MDRIKKKPPFLPFERINTIVVEFLAQQNWQNAIPIPIENIIEALGFDIIPSFQLKYWVGIEGFIIPAKKEIYIDKDILDHPSPNRYYSTLAHELGHHQLHYDYMSDFSSQEDYVYFLRHFDGNWLRWIEAQAWDFARLLLLPSSLFADVYQRAKSEFESANNIDLSIYEKGEPVFVGQVLSDTISEYFQVSVDLAKYRIVNFLTHKL